MGARHLPALVAAVVLVGCGSTGTEEPEASLEERLGGLPGVQGVTVEETPAEDGDEELLTQVAVNLEPDPERDDVIGVLEALIAERKDRNAAYVDSADGWSNSLRPGRSGIVHADDDADPESAARTFLAGLAVAQDLGGEAAFSIDLDPATDAPPSVTLVPASSAPGDVRAAERAVAADPLLRRAGTVVLQQGFR